MAYSLRPEQLRYARRAARLTQAEAAGRVGVSQAYLALMEGGRRRVTPELRARLADAYELGPIALPLTAPEREDWDSSSLAATLASLGYAGFRKQRRPKLHNPATVLLAAVGANNLEVRVLEALPWLALEYSNLDWNWLIREAKLRDLQNRLGFIVTLAREVADHRGDASASGQLKEVEEILDRARLARQDTLCQDSMPVAEREWLRRTRPPQ